MRTPDAHSPVRNQPAARVDGIAQGPPQDSSISLSRPKVPAGYRARLLEDLEKVRSLEPVAQRLLLNNALANYNSSSSGSQRRAAEIQLHQALQGQSVKLAVEPKTDEDQVSWIEDLRRVPQHQLEPSNWNDLFRVLGIESSSEDARSLQRLLNSVGGGIQAQGMRIAYLKEIADQHGAAKLLVIARKLLRFLDEMRDDRPQEGISPARLVADALRDLALPTAIGQGQKGTCAAASIQGKLAAEKPEQYVDLLLTLAKGETYRAPGGQEIRPNGTWKDDEGDHRRLSEKIMQNAIMDLRGRPYSSVEDNDGMLRAESERATEIVFGYRRGQFDQEEPGLFTSKQVMWSYIKDDLARGRPVSISFRGHVVLVVGFDPTKDPNEVLISTWGSLHTMNLEDFLRHMEAVRHVDDPGRDNREIPEDRRTQVVTG